MITISCPQFSLNSLKSQYSSLQNQNKEMLSFKANDTESISIQVANEVQHPKVLLFSPIPLPNLDVKVDLYAGLQRHLINLESAQLLEGKRVLYLNEIKKNNSTSELLCRDASHIIININSLKRSEFPFGGKIFPNGLFSEELCQIGRYAGISNQVNQIDIINFSQEKQFSLDQAQIITELIWYIIEGILNRSTENLQDPTLTQELIIESNQISDSFFVKRSKKSGRYWIKDLNEDIYYACSEEEFTSLKADQIPDRIFKLLL